MIEPNMHAARLHALGDLTQLRYELVQTPAPSAGEVLVKVIAAAITRGELEWPEGRLPAIPSYEFSGVVAATGPGVDQVRVDDEVYALSGFDRDGAAADYTVVPHSVLAAKPRTLDHVQSAAIPLAALSAWQGLFSHGKLEPGQRVMIHGATGGVGAYAVQLARARGACVIATTSAANVQAATELGANETIDYTTTGFEEKVDPVDLVFDTSGGERIARSTRVLRAGGRLVSIVSQPPAAHGIEAVYFVVEPDQEQLSEVARLADEGTLKPTIDKVYALADIRNAFERTANRERRGKIVLRVVDQP